MPYFIGLGLFLCLHHTSGVARLPRFKDRLSKGLDVAIWSHEAMRQRIGQSGSRDRPFTSGHGRQPEDVAGLFRGGDGAFILIAERHAARHQGGI